MTQLKGNNRVKLGVTGTAVANNVSRLRKELGMSFKELEQKTIDAGHRVPAISIRRVEDLTRRVDVDDLMAFAVALGESPAHLLMPLASVPPYATGIPDSVERQDTRAWIQGELDDFTEEALLVHLLKKVQDQIGAVSTRRELVSGVERVASDNPDNVELQLMATQTKELLEHEESQLKQLQDRMESLRQLVDRESGRNYPRPLAPWQMPLATPTPVEFVEVENFKESSNGSSMDS